MKPPRISTSLRLLPIAFLPGCVRVAEGRSPTVDVVGSYFPAWIVCILVGLAATVIIRLLLMASGLHTHLYAKGVVYPCLLLCCTMAVWLLFFQG